MNREQEFELWQRDVTKLIRDGFGRTALRVQRQAGGNGGAWFLASGNANFIPYDRLPEASLSPSLLNQIAEQVTLSDPEYQIVVCCPHSTDTHFIITVNFPDD